MPNTLPFFAAPPLSGIGFETMLDSFRGKVSPFKARPEYGRDTKFQWWTNVVASPDLVLLNKSYSGDWRADLDANDGGLTIILPVSGGRSNAFIEGEKITAVPDQAILVANSRLQGLTARAYPQLVTTSLIVQEGVVSRTLSSLYEGAVLSRLALPPLFDLATSAGATFKLLVQTIVSGMHGDRVLERSPKSLVLLIEALLRLVFETLPHRFSHRARGSRLDVLPRHVKLAVDFMHANMHLPLTVGDIAEAAGVSARSLQAGFQQYCGTTPILHLRRLRLEAVHVELSLPQNVLPIKEVALKWGFSHLGRFAQQYRETYGVHPSVTVKKAQGL